MCKTDEIKCIVVGERSRVKRLGCMASFLWRSEKERQLGMEGKIGVLWGWRLITKCQHEEIRG